MLFDSPEFLDRSRSANFNSGVLEQFLDFVSPEGVCGSVLDLGCGTGFLTKLMVERNLSGRILGVDLSQRLIRAALANHHDGCASQGPEFLVADAGELPFASGVFGLVASLYLYVDCTKPDAIAKEAVRVAEPAGTVCALEPIFQTDLLNSYYPGLDSEDRRVLSGIYYKLVVEAPHRLGIDRTIAPRLPALFRDLGLENVTAKVVGDCRSMTLFPEVPGAVGGKLAQNTSAAQIGKTSELRRDPILQTLSDEEIEFLVSLQARLVASIAHDAEAVRQAGYFDTISFVLVKGTKRDAAE